MCFTKKITSTLQIKTHLRSILIKKMSNVSRKQNLLLPKKPDGAENGLFFKLLLKMQLSPHCYSEKKVLSPILLKVWKIAQSSVFQDFRANIGSLRANTKLNSAVM